MSESANPYAPPQADVSDIALDGPELASRGQRLMAVLFDVFVSVAALWCAAKLLPIDPFDDDPSPAAMGLNLLIGLLLFLVLQGWPLVKHGQTLGKMALSLRIVRSDGARVGAWRILGLRYGIGYVLAVLPAIGLVFSLIDSLLIFRESRKCLHDNIADTIVVRA